jgi:hypothetical protein
MLHLFSMLTLLMVVLSIVVAVIMFEYENVLKLASAAGGELAREGVEEGVDEAVGAIGETSTTIISSIATNAFYACNAVINATDIPMAFSFNCLSPDFPILAATINGTCMDPAVTALLNVSSGSVFDTCYMGAAFTEWTGKNAFGTAVALSASTLLAALNTPKGLFCACSSTLIDTYILPYLAWAKMAIIAVCVFFVVVYCACIHQICKRGCCGDKSKKKALEEKQPEMSSIQMTYPDAAPTQGKKGKKGHSKLNDGGYIARP